MLSNTAETKPRLSAVCHEALGNLSTGISVAHRTNDRRKMLPFTLAGTISQSGRRNNVLTRRASVTDSPMNGKASDQAGN